jgi:hypothetical protein
MKERGHAEFLCHFKCRDRCFSWIVIWGKCILISEEIILIIL